jgi:hypothetical protein
MQRRRAAPGVCDCRSKGECPHRPGVGYGLCGVQMQRVFSQRLNIRKPLTLRSLRADYTRFMLIGTGHYKWRVHEQPVRQHEQDECDEQPIRPTGLISKQPVLWRLYGQAQGSR